MEKVCLPILLFLRNIHLLQKQLDCLNKLYKYEYGNFETPNSERLYYVAIGKIVSIQYNGPFVRTDGPTQLLCTLPNNLRPVIGQRCTIYPYMVNLIVDTVGNVRLDSNVDINSYVHGGITFLRY